MTDTSAAAAQQRAQEQLTSAMAGMVTQGNLEAEQEAAKKREEKRIADEAAAQKVRNEPAILTARKKCLRSQVYTKVRLRRHPSHALAKNMMFLHPLRSVARHLAWPCKCIASADRPNEIANSQLFFRWELLYASTVSAFPLNEDSEGNSCRLLRRPSAVPRRRCSERRL